MTLEDYSGPNLTVDKVTKKIGVPGTSQEYHLLLNCIRKTFHH